MFEHILDCPQCKKRFHYEYEGGTYPPMIHCPECGMDSPYGDFYALILCSGCRGKLKIPLDILHEDGNSCPQCGTKIQPDRVGLDGGDTTYTFADGASGREQKRMLEDGAFFDKFRIIKLLGKGGMAEVYLAEHLLLKQECALKLMQKTLDQDNDPVFIKRFVREAKVTHSLSHPNIVRVFDAGSDFKTGFLFLAMEYVEGKTLHDIIEERALSEDELLAILLVMGGALKTLETAKVVHRDIKPSNIMYTNDGVYKLMDLGIAKVESNHQAGDMTLTMEQSTIGTPGYASPEQCQAAHLVDIRSDIYSLGATLYHAASGVMPFTGDTPVAVILKVMQGEAEPLRNHRSDLSDGFIKLVEKMMKKDPEDRFQSVDELLEAAAKVESGKSLPAPVRKMKTAVTSFATTFFSRKNEKKERGWVSRIGFAGLKIFFTLLLIAVTALHVYYVILNKGSKNISYKDFWATILGHSDTAVKKEEKEESLSLRLYKMHPLILDPDKAWRPVSHWRNGRLEKEYPVVSVFSENFQTYSFDKVHHDFINLVPDILQDGMLNLGSDNAGLPVQPPEYKKSSYLNRGITYVVNFQLAKEDHAALFSFNGVEIFLYYGQLHLVVNNEYHAHTAIKIPPNRWVNLVISLDIEERKIILLSENRLLGIWFFSGNAARYLPLQFVSKMLGQNFGGKIDFLAVAKEPVQILPVQPARYEAFQTHAERLPDRLPKEFDEPVAAEKKNEPDSEKTKVVPAKETQVAVTVQSTAAVAAGDSAGAEKAEAQEKSPVDKPTEKSFRQAEVQRQFFPAWRRNRAEDPPRNLSVDEHLIWLRNRYLGYAEDVKKLQESLSTMPESVPESVRQQRRALAQKAAELCSAMEKRLEYLQNRNSRINAVKRKSYSKMTQRLQDQLSKARKGTIARRGNGGYVKVNVSEREIDDILRLLKNSSLDPNKAVLILLHWIGYWDAVLSNHDSYRIWLQMIQRSFDPSLICDDNFMGTLSSLLPSFMQLVSYGLQGNALRHTFAVYLRNSSLRKDCRSLSIMFTDGARVGDEDLFLCVNDYETLLFLLACGADPNVGREDETPLFFAYRIGDGKAIQDLLLAAGADPGRRNNNGKVASDYAYVGEFAGIWERRDWGEIQNALASGKISPDEILSNGQTLLTWACEKNDAKQVKMLLDFGADPAKTDHTDYSPLCTCCWRLAVPNVRKESLSRIILMLLEKGAKLNESYRSDSILYHIVKKECVVGEDLLKLLPYSNTLTKSQWISLFKYCTLSGRPLAGFLEAALKAGVSPGDLPKSIRNHRDFAVQRLLRKYGQ